MKKEHVPKNWTKKFEKFGGTCFLYSLFLMQIYFVIIEIFRLKYVKIYINFNKFI